MDVLSRKRTYAPRQKKEKRRKTASTSTAVTTVPRRLYVTGNTATFGGYGFPKFLRMKHKYLTTVQVVVTTGQSVAFNCIGLYQPNPAVLTNRVMYFAEVSALYARYNVMGAKCKFTVSPFSATMAQQPQRHVAWINQNSAIAVPGINALAQYKDAQFNIDQGGINPTKHVFYLNWSTAANNHGSVLGNPELAGTAVSNPLESPQFTLTTSNMSTSDPTSYFVTVEIVYDVMWHELIEKAVAI